MLRKRCEISSMEEMEKILKRATVGRLATIGEDGYPYITPVNYVWYDDSIYFHCAHTGEKLDNIRRNNKVCFEVDIPLSYLGLEYDRKRPTCHVHQFYHCIIIRGRAELVENSLEKVASLNALVASHEGNEEFEKVKEDTKGVRLCTVVAVRVDSISGKSDLAQKMSKEEKARVSKYLRERDLPGDSEAARLIGDM